MCSPPIMEPAFVTPEQLQDAQTVFDQVCEEFAFRADDHSARSRLAEAVMTAACLRRDLPSQFWTIARRTAADILQERG
jgi:hypothetical protein